MIRSTSTLFACLILICGCSQFKRYKAAYTPLLNAPYKLSVNQGAINPLGFHSSEIQFSWQLPLADFRTQSAYEIRYAINQQALNTPASWRSKKVKSSQSVYIAYDGPALRSRDTLYWQVRAWDQDHNVSAWSKVAQVELGLLNNVDWQAKWIGLSEIEPPLYSKKETRLYRTLYLRKSFAMSDTRIAKARLYISAKGVFEASINGERVGDTWMTPGWTPYHKRIETLTYDVTNMLAQNSDNALGITLAPGWHSGRMGHARRQWIEKPPPEAIAQLEILYGDGSTQIVTSDKSWLGTSRGPIVQSEIYDGEIYDASREMPNWNKPGFIIQQNREQKWRPVNTADIDEDVKLLPKLHSPVRVKHYLPAKTVRSVNSRKAIFDLGQNIVGIPKVRLPVKANQKITIRFAEMLQDDGSLYTHNYRTAESTNTYIPSSDGVVTWTPKFTFHGFRYVSIEGFDNAYEPKLNWLEGLAQYSDFATTGAFTSSHPKLNQLQQNIVWGMRGNFLDIPTDCPQRDERLGWTGDAQVFANTALLNANVHQFYSAWLASIREEQLENGGISNFIPNIGGTHSMPGWGDAVTVIPWAIYQARGDTTILADNFDMMGKFISYYENRADNYIVNIGTVGDWLQPYSQQEDSRRGDTDISLIGTAYFAHSALIAAKAARLIGNTQEARRLHQLHENVKASFQSHFFDETGRVTTAHETQTSYLLALAFDLLRDSQINGAVANLVRKLGDANNHLRTGFLGTPLITKVLDRYGHSDLAFQVLFNDSYPSWFFSINQGATTIWERWNGYTKEDGFIPRMNSFNHYAYGAVGEWMYSRIAGIQALSPGYKQILFAPQTHSKLSRAAASIESPYGTVSSAWTQTDAQFSLSVTVPANTTGEVKLPLMVAQRVSVNGVELSQAEHLQIVSQGEKFVRVKIAPGNYEFISQ